jgi:NAD(P)-dependent dehydrogenase (short-subunit alcohol dehydrogenase family)
MSILGTGPGAPKRGGKNGVNPVANPVMEEINEALSGRAALVTGGGRGIGRAIALGLADAGARVAVLARSADEVNQTASLIDERGQLSLPVAADVSDAGQVDAALYAIRDEWGPIEVLVNNAAVVWPLGPSVELDLVDWETALAINVTAPARLAFAVLPAMLERGWGRIVNVSSGIAAHPAAMLRANAYATTKAALEAHTLNLAAELAGSGVAVNVFRPGGVDTAMQAWIRDQDPVLVGADLHRRFLDNYEQGTLLSPEQSASSLLARLARPETGQIWDAADGPRPDRRPTSVQGGQ